MKCSILFGGKLKFIFPGLCNFLVVCLVVYWLCSVGI